MDKRTADVAELDASIEKRLSIIDNRDVVLEELSAGNIEGFLAMEVRSSIISLTHVTDTVLTVLSTLPLTLDQFQRFEANFGPVPAHEISSLLRWQLLSPCAPFSEQLLLHLVSRFTADPRSKERNLLVLALRAGPNVLPASVFDAIAAKCGFTLVWPTIAEMVAEFTPEMAGYVLIVDDLDCTVILHRLFLQYSKRMQISENALNAMALHHNLKVNARMTWLEKACRRLSTTHTSWLISKLRMHGRGLVTPEWVAAATRRMLTQRGADLFATTLVLQTLRALCPIPN